MKKFPTAFIRSDSIPMKKAFTLIELLIVIAIIGILAGILFVSIGQTPLIKSRDSKRVADLQNLRTALTLYYSDKNSFPDALATLKTGSYIPEVPLDPRDGVAFTAGVAPLNCPSTYNGGNYGYVYTGGGCVSGNCTSFTIQACLERPDNPALATDANNQNSPIYDIKS